MLGKKNSQPEIQDIQDRAYDLFGELVFEKEANELLAEMKADGEESTESEEFIARVDARSLGIIEKYSRKVRVRRFLMQTMPRLGQIAAVIIVVITLAGCTALAASETVRVYLLHLLVETTNEYTILSLVPSETDYVDVPDEWEGCYYPAYIPEGLKPISILGNTAYYSYEESPPVFVFGEYDEGSVVQIDTEDAETIQTTIHGQLAYISTKGTTIKIYWSEGLRYFVLTFRGMSAAIALSVADSVTQIREN
ncbi:MAG: DUF4367 domain-containing protein [Lachnospiraceae bacterium]|nr:DUF4367 domain-containing protein [Lachnospiraceae bacterium]